MDNLAQTAAYYDRIRDEIADSVDEEMEMTLDEESLDGAPKAGGALDRRIYFKELFRLQRELVKLQD